eukprot:1642354-Amphidinium_carterae.1
MCEAYSGQCFATLRSSDISVCSSARGAFSGDAFRDMDFVGTKVLGSYHSEGNHFGHFVRT